MSTYLAHPSGKLSCTLPITDMIDYRSRVSIAIIVLYVPVFFTAIFLATRHGFKLNSGWICLIVFAVIRMLYSSFQLATIHRPTDVGLYIGAAVMSGVGLGPLVLAAVGMLIRVRDTIRKNHETVIVNAHLHLIQAVTILGVILALAGGIKAGENFKHTGHFITLSLTKIAISLFVVAFAAILTVVFFTAFNVPHIERGERRLLLAVGLSLPFLFVRLIYSCYVAFANEARFSLINGDVSIMLAMGVIQEFIIVMIYLSTGLTLRIILKEEMAAKEKVTKSDGGDHGLVLKRFPLFKMLEQQRLKNHQAWYGEEIDDHEMHERLT